MSAPKERFSSSGKNICTCYFVTLINYFITIFANIKNTFYLCGIINAPLYFLV